MGSSVGDKYPFSGNGERNLAFCSAQRRHWQVLHYFSAAVVLAKLVQELALVQK